MPKTKHDDRGKEVWVAVGRVEHIAHLVHGGEVKPGKVLIQWQDSTRPSDRIYVDEADILEDVIYSNEAATRDSSDDDDDDEPRKRTTRQNRRRLRSQHGDQQGKEIKQEPEDEKPLVAARPAKRRLSLELPESFPAEIQVPTAAVDAAAGDVSVLPFSEPDSEDEGYSPKIPFSQTKTRKSKPQKKRKAADHHGHSTHRSRKRTSTDNKTARVSLGKQEKPMTYSSRDRLRRASMEARNAKNEVDSDSDFSFHEASSPIPRPRANIPTPAAAVVTTAKKTKPSSATQASAITPRYEFAPNEGPNQVTTAKAVRPGRRTISLPQRTTRAKATTKTTSPPTSILSTKTTSLTNSACSTEGHKLAGDESPIEERRHAAASSSEPVPSDTALHSSPTTRTIHETASLQEPQHSMRQPEEESKKDNLSSMASPNTTEDDPAIMMQDDMMDHGEDPETFFRSSSNSPSPDDAMCCDNEDAAPLDDPVPPASSSVPKQGIPGDERSVQVDTTLTTTGSEEGTTNDQQLLLEYSPPAPPEAADQPVIGSNTARDPPAVTSPSSAMAAFGNGNPDVPVPPATTEPSPVSLKLSTSRTRTPTSLTAPTKTQRQSIVRGMKSPGKSNSMTFGVMPRSSSGTPKAKPSEGSATTSSAASWLRTSVSPQRTATEQTKESLAAPAPLSSPSKTSQSEIIAQTTFAETSTTIDMHPTTEQSQSHKTRETQTRTELEVDKDAQTHHHRGPILWDDDSASETMSQTSNSEKEMKEKEQQVVSTSTTMYDVARSLVMTEGTPTTTANAIIDAIEDHLDVHLTSLARMKLKVYIDDLLADIIKSDDQKLLTTTDLDSNAQPATSNQALDIFLEDGIDCAHTLLLRNFHNRQISKVSLFADASSVASFAQSATLFSSIATLPNLQEVTISYCSNELNINQLNKCFTRSNSIRKLELINVILTGRDEDFHALSKSDRKLQSLQELHLVECAPSEGSNPGAFQAWLSHLTMYAPLTKVWLDETGGLSADFIGKLCRTFQRFELGLRRMPVPCNILSFGTLTALHLIDCFEICTGDALVFPSQTPMKELFLWGKMTQEMAVEFFQKLQSDTGLERLTLSITGGADTSALRLEDLIEKNTMLRRVDLIIFGGVQNAAKEAALILKALETNHHIESFRILVAKKDEIERQTIQQIQFAKTFRKNRTIQTIHLFGQEWHSMP